jgi:tetratricopeptide (TPR) repeat protein
LEAEKKLVEAMELYEDALRRDRVSPEAQFGEIYSNLGDIYYYVSADFDVALTDYLSAERNGYSSPDLYYKIGNIRYIREEFEGALLRMYQAAGDYSANLNLMYATANTLFRRGNYAAAQGYYLHIVDILEARRKNIEILRPEERPDHRALIENLQKVYNNLGVAVYNISQQTGEESKVSTSLVYLMRSSEFFDRLARNQETMVRPQSKNLAYLNTRSILYPLPDFELELYNPLPRDMQDLDF